jgi:hypothetical protein
MSFPRWIEPRSDVARFSPSRALPIDRGMNLPDLYMRDPKRIELAGLLSIPFSTVLPQASEELIWGAVDWCAELIEFISQDLFNGFECKNEQTNVQISIH